ncbi:unnamed protein product [Dovyalis caffra]|uniref:Uncharacterized protein n=1 Tax=Dovyalis caffra TaxID=77055 RepID=A0AAV1RR91_9ROSI|nr:unnamed protein product [Dovyalis caffra]
MLEYVGRTKMDGLEQKAGTGPSTRQALNERTKMNGPKQNAALGPLWIEKEAKRKAAYARAGKSVAGKENRGEINVQKIDVKYVKDFCFPIIFNKHKLKRNQQKKWALELIFSFQSLIFCKSAYLKPGTSEWDSVRSQVWKAISKDGCFKALFDKIPVENQKTLLCSLEERFDLPLPAKSRCVSENPFRSYFESRSVPRRESFGIQDPLMLKNCDDNFCIVSWSEGNPSLR